jgi:hypothetical protein
MADPGTSDATAGHSDGPSANRLAPTGHILLPDAIERDSLVSLNRARNTYSSANGQAHLRQFLHELQATASPQSSRVLDLFTAALLEVTKRGSLDLFVLAHPPNTVYQISLIAMREGRQGFLSIDTIETGHLAVVPSLMLHGSLAARLEGAPILVREMDVDEALKRRPSSDATVKAVVKEVIDLATSQDEELSNEEVVKRVRAHDLIWRVSKERIRKENNKQKPAEWGRHGPRRRARRNK